jgi:hypothetical protein
MPGSSCWRNTSSTADRKTVPPVSPIWKRNYAAPFPKPFFKNSMTALLCCKGIPALRIGEGERFEANVRTGQVGELEVTLKPLGKLSIRTLHLDQIEFDRFFTVEKKL